MTPRSDSNKDDYQSVFEAAKEAYAQGERGRARRLCRRAIQLAPQDELPWVLLAKLSEPQAGLAYLVHALEINPKSRIARDTIRKLARRMPVEARREAFEEIDLPDSLAHELLPSEALTLRRLLSSRVVLTAMLIVMAAGVYLGGQPADALQPQMSSAGVAKATLTPTATPTPTPTSTPTPTLTPTATLTPTQRPAVSFHYTNNPQDLADEGRWIDVDLSAQRVTAYQGATAVKTFVVSTGTSRHPTVTGQFMIYMKLSSTAMAGPGYYLPGVPYTMYFYKGYSLHGTYWHNNFGTPMSHGCVNLRTPDAEWLFNFASIGTLVNVHP